MFDLLDARGCEVSFTTSDSTPVKINYIGAAISEHEEITFDEDKFVVSRVENETFEKEYKVVVKDPGLSKSGLVIELISEKETYVEVTLAGEKQEKIHLISNLPNRVTYNTLELCKEEREYLRNLHRILYIMLDEIDRVCVENSIEYYIVFGGLLGVYRYGELIPWDDDIDIAMTRENFEKFKAVASKKLSPDFMYLDYTAIGGDKPCFLDFMCRILYMKEQVPGNVFKKVTGKCREDVPNRQAVDIYILDKASDDMKRHKRHMFLIRTIYGLSMSKRAYIDKKDYAGRDRFTRMAVWGLSTIGKIIPSKTLFKLHDKISTKYEKLDTKDYFISNGYLPFIHTRYSKEWFMGGERIQFGKSSVCIPNDYEAFLKRAYYDYYHFRPMKDRIPQHSPTNHGVI